MWGRERTLQSQTSKRGFKSTSQTFVLLTLHYSPPLDIRMLLLKLLLNCNVSLNIQFMNSTYLFVLSLVVFYVLFLMESMNKCFDNHFRPYNLCLVVKGLRLD